MKLTNNIFRTLYFQNLGENFVFSPYSYLRAVDILLKCVNVLNKSEIIEAVENLDVLKSNLQNSKFVEEFNSFLYSYEYQSVLNNDILDNLKQDNIEIKDFFDKGLLCSYLNSLVNEKTHGLIKEIIRESELGDLIKFVIINIIYFKAKWFYELNYTNNEEPFNGSDKSVNIKYLGRYEYFKYYEDNTVQIVELPFKDSNIKCHIYVPRGSLFEVVNSLEENINKSKLCKSDEYKIDFYCPAFKIESQFDNLIELSEQNGIKNVFKYSKEWSFLDFDKLSQDAVLKIDKIRQKAVFDFSKDGVEAAAVTAMFMVMSGCCFPPTQKKKVIEANKPFLFTLSEGDSLFFIGMVNNL